MTCKTDTYLLTNLYPATTGLSMTVWVCTPGYVRDYLCIMEGQDLAPAVIVNTSPGPRTDLDDSVVVALRPSPHPVGGSLAPSDLAAVSRWITANEPALLAHWNGEIDGVGLAERLVPLPSQKP